MRDETADVYARVHNRVDEILHYIWDPIGVAGAPGARDEYDAYVPTLVKMLFDGATADQVADYLGRIESESMGLSMTSTAKRREVASRLLEHYRWINRPR